MSRKYPIRIATDIRNLVKDLKEEYKLTNYEALIIALKAEQNDLIKTAFVISSMDEYPTALEAIAIGLGYNNLGK